MLPASQTIADRDLRLNLFLERRVHFNITIKPQPGWFVNGKLGLNEIRRSFNLIIGAKPVKIPAHWNN